MKFIKQRLGVHLKRLCEEIVQVDFVCFVDARDSNRAAVTGLTGARGSTQFFLFTVSLNHCTCSGSYIDFFSVSPVFKCGMVRDESSCPLVGIVNYIFVHTILEVFLLVRIKEKVQTGEVTKGGEFGYGSSVLFMERGEQFVVQVTDLFLSNGGERIDGVKPNVEGRLLSQLGKTSILEVICVFDLAQCSYKSSSLGHHRLVVSAKSIHSFVEVFNIGSTAFFDGCVCDWTEEAQCKVSCMEA